MDIRLSSIKGIDYKVSFSDSGYKELNNLIENYSSIFILVDLNTSRYCLTHLLEKVKKLDQKLVITINPGEDKKNLETCHYVWKRLSDLNADRKSLLINLGGGVISDLGGFVASAFKRGISFINVPTTLLSMVDASVGGKTGVDFHGLKNLIGFITNPSFVIIDYLFLKTLPVNEYKSGYAEMLKHGIIRDSKFFKTLSNFELSNSNNIARYIHYSISIKNDIVNEDPYENGLRKILNFGHTLGHAIESYFLNDQGKKRLLHGEAIAVGMITEAFLSTKFSGLKLEVAKKIKDVFLAIFPKIYLNKKDITSILQLLKYDKKNSFGKVKFVLLKELGKTVIDVEITEQNFFFEAFDFYNKN